MNRQIFKINIMIKNLQKIIELLKINNLKEISCSNSEMQIKVSAHDVHIIDNKNPCVTQATTEHKSNEQSSKVNDEIIGEQVISPIVGTCYLAPEPGARNFINVGDTVQKGQPLLIIEAMKVMNYIKAPKDGIISEIKVKDAQPVEFGQVLVIIN